MSFWALEKNDTHDTVYLLPQIMSFSGKKTQWSNILRLRRRVLIFMLATSAPFGCLLFFSGVFIAWMAVTFVIQGYAPDRIVTALFFLGVSILLIYTAIRTAQSWVRLIVFLNRGIIER